MEQFITQANNPRDVMLELLDYAAQVLEHDAFIDGLTIDDAAAEDAFAEVREALNNAVEKVQYYVDK